MKRLKGFTLIELMVTMIVLVIVAMFAAPSFDNLRRGLAIDSSTTKIRNALSYARSEAVTQSQFVTVCIGNVTMDGCAVNVADWADGWLVFGDENVDGVLDADETLMRVWEGGIDQEGTLIEQSAPPRSFIIFDRNGYVQDRIGMDLELRLQGCQAGELSTISVMPLGRVNVNAGGDC